MSVSSLQRPSYWQGPPKPQRRVGFGTPADGVLQRGDVITKIGSYDGRDIRHQDAQNLFRNAGNDQRVVVAREVGPRTYSTGSSRSSSRNYNSPLSVSPHISPRGGNAYNYNSQYSPAGAALTPTYGQPFEELRDGFYSEIPDVRAPRKYKGNLDEKVVNQPYRTTPLVLPGAKVKPDQTVTECYLRHHPDPAVRAHPHDVDTDNLYKQKVADAYLQRVSTNDPRKQIVHKQFNSPITLYDDAHIVDTLQKQTGAGLARPPVKFDPSKSPTLRYLQEQNLLEGPIHEIKVPPQARVYNPAPKTVSFKPQPQVQPARYEDPVQSHSFKRLMWSVLPETDY